MRLNEFTEQPVKEGYYDLPNQGNVPGMEPIDFASNPSFKDIIDRYTQLVYQGHTSETSPEEDQEHDEIEQYVAQHFGEKGSAHLQKAAEVSYWGRDDKPYGRDSRSSNLGRPNQPGGNFRTTKAGKMHGQDAKMMKAKVADRLGRHPEPNLPEAYEPVDRPYGAYRSGIFSPNRGIARRSLTAVNKFLEKPFNSHQKRTDFLLDLVPDRNLKEIVGVLAYEHFPFDDLREKPWFMRRLNSLIARAERKLNQGATESVEEGAVEGEDDPWGDGHSRGSAAGTMNAPHSKYPEGSEDHKLYMTGYKQGVTAYNNKVKQYKKSSKEQGMSEGSGLDNYRQRVNSQGFTDSPEERDADRSERKRRHQDALNRISDIGGGSSDEERAHQAQQRMARDEYKLDRLKRNDDDWENTFDMMRDRMNRYQWSSQRDVDPEQLAAISNIKYEPRKKNEAVQAKTDDKLLAYYAQRKAEKEKQGVAEAGIPFRGTAGAFNRGDDERHDLDVPRPTIYALKINGKIWQKDGNVVTFFTRERALAARNSILNKRPELEVGLVQRQD